MSFVESFGSLFGFLLDFYFFMLPALLFSMYAQYRVRTAFARYGRIPNSRMLRGEEVAALLMRNERINDVKVDHVKGQLTDYYNTRTNVMYLSDSSREQPSVAAMAIVAHELGHAQQDLQRYPVLILRNSLGIIASMGANLGWFLLLFGTMLAGSGGQGAWLVELGILLMGGMVLFTAITLPVELNASKRAREMLAANNLMSPADAVGVNAVLNAAALTYVAGVVQSVFQFFFFARLLGQPFRSR